MPTTQPRRAPRLVSAALTVVVLGTGALSASPAAGVVAPDRGERGGAVCDVRRDGGQYRHGPFTVTGAKIFQSRTKGFGPGVSESETVTVGKGNQYQAGAKVGGSLKTSIGNKWVGEAEVEAHAEMSSSGTWSTNRQRTITQTINNPTRHNLAYVFYRGYSRTVSAPVMLSTCVDDDGGDPFRGHLTWRRVGTFRTFSHVGDGAVACRSGRRHLDSIGRAALEACR